MPDTMVEVSTILFVVSCEVMGEEVEMDLIRRFICRGYAHVVAACRPEGCLDDTTVLSEGMRTLEELLGIKGSLSLKKQERR